MDEQRDRYAEERERMVADQIEWRGIKDQRLLDALRQVPRHLFVPEAYRDMAYSDGPLGIGEGQTISQPYIVALMTNLLHLGGDERVLEVGTGSGYQAAILSLLCDEVYTVERYPTLAARAENLLRQLGYDNVHVHVGDGTLGLPEYAPYDGIIVTAAAPEVPRPLLNQLVDGGRLVLPVGGRYNQMLELWQKEGEHYRQRAITPVAFVPLLGKYGWDEKDWDKFRFW